MFWNFLIVGIILVISILLSNYFMNFNNPWYRSLKMPSFQPPPITFSIVWTLLYLILWYTISVSYPKDTSILYYFIALAILLVAWAFVFFQLKSPWGASIVLFTTFIVSWIIWSKLVKVSPTQTVPTLFLLFIAWIFLATTLNTKIAILN